MRIVIADSDMDFCEMLCAELARRIPAAQVECVTDGLELLQRAEAKMPELIVLNVLLPGRDGLAVMQTIRVMDLPSQPEFIVLSGYFSQQIRADLCRMRPAYYTALPCDIGLLGERIMRCCSHAVYRQTCREADDDERITRLLREMGLSMRCKGFRYAREAVRRAADMPEEQVSVTKVIYPAVAAMFRTTAVNVERAIRSAVLAAWQKEGCLRQRELFRDRPTNSEFLAVLAEVLRQERRHNAKREELEG
ncbi:MAG: response regulator [Clostridia bacterium]|nr:response regulator [Clostridia bacterium]